MNQKSETIQCTHCLKTFRRNQAKKICSNCFACQGCEIYQCPYCKGEVILEEKR